MNFTVSITVAFSSQIIPEFEMQRLKTILFQSCFLCFVVVEIPFFPSSLCPFATTSQPIASPPAPQ